MPDKGKPQDTEPLLPIYHPIRPRVSVKSAICTTFLDVTILVLASIIVTMWVYPVLQNMSFVNNEPFVKVDSVIGHLTALQGIALKHGGSRSVATGHAESVKFVTGKLQKLNGTMKYWTQDVAIEIQVDASPPNVNLHVRDRDIHMVPRIDVTVVQGSGSANVSSAYLKFFDECEPSNIDGDWVAVIAYNWPSKCHPCERIIHAVDSGAKAIIMYTRPGNQQGYPHALPPSPAPGRCHKSETLTSMQKVGVISLSDTAAFNLLQAVLEDNTTIDISIDSEYKSIISQNIISETHKGDSNKIILFGSHLDSVPAGPGINDDGSGAMATLALAEALDRSQISSRLVQKLRFAWWTGEEIGLLGSTYYVKDLKKNSPAELNAHLLTIDTDMIASSNYVRGLWDASQLEDKKLAHACGLIQDVFKQHFNSKNLDTTPFYFNGRSDFAPFMDEGIPSGGVITGEDEIKTIEGAASFGGVVGMVLDPCYHQDCDRVETLSAGPARDILVQNLDALSFVLQYFATHSSLVSSLWN